LLNEFSDGSLAKEQEIKAPSGIGAGGGGVAAPAPAMENLTSKKIATDEMRTSLPYFPEIIEYKYIFNEEDIVLDQSTLEVYRQVKSSSGAKSLGQVLGNFDLGVIDLGQFSSAEVKSLHLSEEKDYGYNIHLNLEENAIDISQNWKQWPQANRDCKDSACYERNRLNLEDVPADDKIIKVSDKFVTEMGINLDNYGQAEVNHYWKREMEQYPERQVWIPENVSVVYPLKINSQLAHDFSGDKTGLNVSVNIREMKVSGLHSLKPYNFEASSYTAVTDKEQVKKMLEQGGWQNYFGQSSGEQVDKIVEINLGKPQLNLIRYYNYNQENGESDELFVPSLVFPVENISDKELHYYRQAVIVPLVKDIFDKDMEDRNKPLPTPLLRGGGVAEPM
jgi:hypothetical protein